MTVLFIKKPFVHVAFSTIALTNAVQPNTSTWQGFLAIDTKSKYSIATNKLFKKVF